ncbi:hypothetical protein [Roseospira marina]|uniref:hypothetical protein n=1 Tax=Roseospira marina TaxID=140057 RepID=UPI0017BDF63A|nr:hypothetical protein [Roseospira marina]MBB4313865.1 hypothetical protein [Roseospira marina]MBB5087027.1 hypothetical protein [Roseospira marina]
MVPRVKLLAATLAVTGAVSVLTPGLASANEFQPQIEQLLANKIKPWLSDPVIISAVKAQNAEHDGLEQGRIDDLDQQWRDEAETGSGPLIDAVTGNDLSAFLSTKKTELDGVVSEMFVMDNIGLNVGQSDITSDYWQGDEAKWQQTYPVGPDAVFIDEVEFDDSAEAFLSQASLTLVDPETGVAIGAITIGINVEKLF